MGKIIPFFHYDLLARVVPGALTLGVLAYAGVALPERWVPLLAADTKWGTVVIPLVFAGSSYVIGVLYEALFCFPGLLHFWEYLASVAFDRAYRHEHDIQYGWRHPDRLTKLVCALKEDGIQGNKWRESLKPIEADLKQPLLKKGKIVDRAKFRSRIRKRERELRFATLNGLVHAAVGEKAPLFAHALRFQSEARMCLHCVAPAVLFCVIAIRDYRCFGCTQQGLQVTIGFVLLALLAWGMYTRERRRWLQILIAARYMLQGT